MVFSFKVGEFIEFAWGCRHLVVLSIFVGVRPFKGFVGLRRRTESNDHRTVNLFHHLCLGDQHHVLSIGGIGDDVSEDKRIFTEFRGDEPVDFGGSSCRVCIWINSLRNDAVFLHEILLRNISITGKEFLR
jgi:hypothetical protein